MRDDDQLPRLMDDPDFKSDFVDLSIEQDLLTDHNMPAMREKMIKAALAAGGLSLVSLGSEAQAATGAASPAGLVATTGATTAGAALSTKILIAGALALSGLGYGAGRVHENRLNVKTIQELQAVAQRAETIHSHNPDERVQEDDNVALLAALDAEAKDLGLAQAESEEGHSDLDARAQQTPEAHSVSRNQVDSQNDEIVNQHKRDAQALAKTRVERQQADKVQSKKPESQASNAGEQKAIEIGAQAESVVEDDVYDKASEIRFVPVANQSAKLSIGSTATQRLTQPLTEAQSGTQSGTQKSAEQRESRSHTQRSVEEEQKEAKMSGEVAHFRRAYLAMASSKYELAATLFESYLDNFPEGRLRVEARIRWLEAKLKLDDTKAVINRGSNLAVALKDSPYQKKAIELVLKAHDSNGTCAEGGAKLSKALKDDGKAFEAVQSSIAWICR